MLVRAAEKGIAGDGRVKMCNSKDAFEAPVSFDRRSGVSPNARYANPVNPVNALYAW